jgi:hypothetical protein
VAPCLEEVLQQGVTFEHVHEAGHFRGGELVPGVDVASEDLFGELEAFLLGEVVAAGEHEQVAAALSAVNSHGARSLFVLL